MGTADSGWKLINLSKKVNLQRILSMMVDLNRFKIGIIFILFLLAASLPSISNVPQSIAYLIILVFYFIICLWYVHHFKGMSLLGLKSVVTLLGIILMIGTFHLITNPTIEQFIRIPIFMTITIFTIMFLPRVFDIWIFYAATAIFASVFTIIGLFPVVTGHGTYGVVDISVWSGTNSMVPILENSIRSIYRNPNTLGFVATMGSLGSIAIYVERKSTLFAFTFSICTFGILASDNRTGVLVLTVTVLLYITYIYFGKKGVGIITTMGATIAATGISMMLGLVPGPNVISSMTLSSRIDRWLGASIALSYSPLIGFGFGSEHLIPYLPDEIFGLTPHNSFVRVTLATGLIGGIAYTTMFGVLLVNSWKNISEINDLSIYIFLVSVIIVQMFEGATIFGMSLLSILMSLIVGYSQISITYNG